MTEADTFRKLRTLAETATRGPWMGPRITDQLPPGWVGVYAADEAGAPLPFYVIGVTGHTLDEESPQATDDAAFIAAANPKVVLALLDEIERLRDTCAPLRGKEMIDIAQGAAKLTDEEIKQLRAALTEALNLFDAVWCPAHGHAPKPEQLARAVELRKLLP